MTFAQLVFHAVNFVLPALALAVFMPLAGRWVMGPGAMPWQHRVLWQAAAGTGVLVAGLVVLDHDGQMATYAALAGVSGTLEWALHRGWRR